MNYKSKRLPRYREIFIKKEAKIIVWKITESEEELIDQIQNSLHLEAIKTRKAESSRKQYLASRIILEQEGVDDEMIKDANGKPKLKDRHVSITHDSNYAAVMIANYDCGIDLQSISDKVLRIKHKFFDDNDVLLDPNELNGLTIAWSIKEALHKLNGDPMVYFKEHMRIVSGDMHTVQTKILHPDYLKGVTLELRKIDDLYLAYTV